ncbi:MAG TPA: energy transducer TonB, partial [Telluria sp.]|nr:energy transducer TonB [Telluria sp.]
LHRVAQAALPGAVVVTFVAPPAARQPAEAAAPTPAQVAPPALLVPAMPALAVAPAEHALSPPPPAPVPASAADKAAPAAVAAAPAAGPRTLSAGVEYLRAPQPLYPSLSKRLGEQGQVLLRVLVNEQGLPDQVVVLTSSGSARLDEAARQAALHALFKPHIEDGRPVAVFVLVPLNFLLAS